MPRPTPEDKLYAELLVAACLTWLGHRSALPSSLPGLLLLDATGDRQATLRVRVTTPKVLVQLITECSQIPSFRLAYPKRLLKFHQLCPSDQYDALRDAIGTMRTYGLITEPQPKQRGNSSKECCFHLFIGHDPRDVTSHDAMLKRLFQDQGRWDQLAQKRTKTRRSRIDVRQQVVQLQQGLDGVLGWISLELFPEKLTGYNVQKAKSLASLVALLQTIVDTNTLPEGIHLPALLLKLAVYYVFQTQLDQAYALLEQCYVLQLTPQQKATSLHYLGVIYHQRWDFPWQNNIIGKRWPSKNRFLA